MPATTIVAIVAITSGLAYLLWLAFAGYGRVTATVRSNLQRGMSTGQMTPLTSRSSRRGGLGRRLVGRRATGLLERLIVRAGRPEKWPLGRRGRSDHVANPVRAAEAWELSLTKYADELKSDPELLSFYHFRAAREHLVARHPRRAVPHVRPALGANRLRRSFHLCLGTILGVKGLAVAQKLLPL